MSQRFIQPLKAGFLALLFVFTGCGGDRTIGTPNVITDPEISLSSLDVAGYDINFDPTRSGPYEIHVANDVTSIDVTAVLGREDLILRTYQTSTAFNVISDFFEDTESGTPKTFQLGEGINLIYVRVQDNDLILVVDYIIKVSRVSSTAGLAFWQGTALTLDSVAQTVGTELIDITPDFASDEYAYTATVPYNACGAQLFAASNQVGTRIELAQPGGQIKQVTSNVIHESNLAVGVNEFLYTLTAEDGISTAEYAFSFTRSAPTAEQEAANGFLQSLTVSEGTLDFACLQSQYLVAVNQNVETVDIVATPEVAGATILINEEAYVAGEPYTVEVTDEFQTVTVNITSADESVSGNYSVVVARLLRNRVDVSTAEELQAALQNAQPNDEIRLEPGTYVGVAGVDSSGSDAAHFFSNASGTEDSLIYLTSASESADTPIISGGGSELPAFLLTGSYWKISGVQFSSASNGVVLDAASNNTLTEISVNSVSGEGLLLRNGSTSNVIANSTFTLTGVGIAEEQRGMAEAIVVGSDDSLWLDQPEEGDGLYAPGDNNNVIRANTFSGSIASEAIEINEGSVDTIIEYNIFESGGLTNQDEDDSILHIQGNGTAVRYNTFYHTADANLGAYVEISGASEDWHAQNWGEDTQVYQNLIVSSIQDIPFVDSNNVISVEVAENVRADEGEVTYIGTGIDESSLAVPVYQIRAAADATSCLGPEPTELPGVGEIQFIVTETCSDADLYQQWKLVVDKDKFVHIQNVGDPEYYLRTISDYSNLCQQSDTASTYVFMRDLVDGFVYSWFLDFDGDVVQIKNKANLAFAITVASESFEVDSTVAMCVAQELGQQRFQLVEMAQ